MGNQLVAFAPSIIRPIEFYLTDIPELQFDLNLGSTRFLKVCRGKLGNLYYVVKVFVIHEHTLPIEVYCERLLSLRNSLSSSPSPNCLAFTHVKTTERSIIVLRPYIKYSLYDRMSTRPFIQWSEKLWIAFQLLCGLAQVHKHGLSHGDLKLENILITPGLRLLLTDFAPFKPVYLPRNNPSAIFGFFFDTSGRRSCYIAPERFHDDKSKHGFGADNLLTQEEELKHFLLPSMDIFSAGCCLIELFTEGSTPFDLSQLLSFCSGEYDPSSITDKIENEAARELVVSMIQINPNERRSSEEYLTKYRGKLFPHIFYSSLQSYYDILAFQPLLTPDARMMRLYQDLKTLPDDPTLSLIFTSLITAEIRGLVSPSAKLNALSSLLTLSSRLPHESILERVVPYILHLLHDATSPRVKAQALDTLLDCLDIVQELPSGEEKIFSGYIFPSLAKLDTDVAVRVGMARNIGRLAMISMRYLLKSFESTSSSNSSSDKGQDESQINIALSAEREIVSSFLRSLLTDSDPGVKRVLVSTPYSLSRLCDYFGRVRAHDLLLSHLITFLNDKEDAELRKAFFESVPQVASFIGWHAAPLLIPLLKQGLTDEEEFVVRSALLAIKSLAEIKFLSRRSLLDLLSETVPFLIHPNLWLRNGAAGVLSAISTNLSQVDVHCHVIRRVREYLKPNSPPLSSVSEVSILSKVKWALERQVYESCLRAKPQVLLSTVDALRNGTEREESGEVRNFIERLRAEGLPSPLDSIYSNFLKRQAEQTRTHHADKSLKISSQSRVIQSNVIPLQGQPLRELLFNISSPPPISGNIGGVGIEGGVRSFPGSLERFNERPRGVLVAHLHEHRNWILKLCPLTAFSGIFGTCSRENVRFWDAERMEGRNVANRSRCMIKVPGDGVLTSMAYAAGQNIVGVTDDKNIYGYQLENMVAQLMFNAPITPGRDEVEIPVALESYSPNLFVAGTEMGSLIGFDVRSGNKEVFRLKSDLSSGLLTTMAFSEDSLWMCTGTSKGVLTCWDLRFGIPVNVIRTETPIRKVKPSPFHPWGVFSCSRSQNEVSLWNLETGSRHICLWAAPSPPLPKAKKPETSSSSSTPGRGVGLGSNYHSVLGLSFVKKYSAVLTVGTDMHIRWWELNSPPDSRVLMSPEKGEQQIVGSLAPPRTSEFKFRLVDGVEVIQDIGTESRGGGESSGAKNSPSGSIGSTNSGSAGAHSIVMGNCHHNMITDVGVVSTPSQSFIVTTSSDGVVKVWK